MQFTKYYALGNDYILLDPASIGASQTALCMRSCLRHDETLRQPVPLEQRNRRRQSGLAAPLWILFCPRKIGLSLGKANHEVDRGTDSAAIRQ